MKRVNIFKNGSSTNGKVILVTSSFNSLLETAGKKLNVDAKIMYTAQGGEVDDINLIRDADVLYVSSGEPFIEIVQSTSNEPISKQFASHRPPAALISKETVSNPDWLLLNVGGRHFATTRSTLLTKEPNSMLACMIASEESSLLRPSSVDNYGAFLIDRSPVYFEPILNYLRHGQLILDKTTNPRGVLEEARFFGIESLVKILEKNVQEEQHSFSDGAALTRRDVINALISTSYATELRFQGVNLSHADLSRLDLRHINFKYANLHEAKLSGANLSYCCLERTDLSHANLEGAILLGVKMLCANLEGANLRSCNMEDPAGNRANMEGAVLEGSQMAGVNLRVATLKNANLQNCDLRGAVLAGADLENCDLSGSDLHEANLRGANLKDTAFELMLTPLHMSQAIR
ncbi:BTB/POZ domain-containing protein KCTD9 isoform X2 [Parasteatoda tepidariorum]|uniref:BTB/POZ domain-containing protein KCTD9 isoform X2 n=1 Tax=Parasteatoda tepidariorum TaxID=114398 RepID=UPI001C725E44|nr:BTB/POZ domain-containing protein KCTD9 isoform X2 [Parasteatoda tepidariorum]